MRIARGYRFIRAMLVCLGIVFTLSQPVSAESEELDPSGLTAQSAILIDAESGLALFEKNADQRMYPASITKIITAIVALETADLSEIVTVSAEARKEDGTRVYLAEGEQVTMEKLLYGMMVNSGNDAATAIAEHLDGSKEQFAARMNEFIAEKAGAENTNMTNPSGLPDPDHVTTARDMAKISAYAMRNDKFREIVGTKEMAWKGEEWETTLINHNQLLGAYEGITGIKNGFTNAAGFTLVASADRGGMKLIGVALKSASRVDLYADMTKLLDYGFERFAPQTLIQPGATFSVMADGQIRRFTAREPVRAVVPLGADPGYRVNANGEVVLQTKLGPQTAGRLEALPVASEQAAAEPVTPPGAEPAERSGGRFYQYAVFVVWLLMLMFMALLGAMIIRKHRRFKRRGPFSGNG